MHVHFGTILTDSLTFPGLICIDYPRECTNATCTFYYVISLQNVRYVCVCSVTPHRLVARLSGQGAMNCIAFYDFLRTEQKVCMV